MNDTGRDLRYPFLTLRFSEATSSKIIDAQVRRSSLGQNDVLDLGIRLDDVSGN